MVYSVDQSFAINTCSRQHAALSIPEIVSHIASFLTKENQGLAGKHLDHLYPCLFVNRLWHDCASRLLWRKVVFEDNKVDPSAFVKFATVFASTPKVPHLSANTTPMGSTAALAVAAATKCQSIPPSALVKARLPTIPHYIDPIATLHAPQPQPNNRIAHNTISDVQHVQELNSHHLKLYRCSLRSLALRKIKDKSIVEPLAQIGENAIMLERLEIYICDNITNDAIHPFLPHHSLTHLTLAGCHQISDQLILEVARQCPDLEHLDLRACGLVSDVSISEIALRCPKLRHLNVGRIRDRELISVKSIGLIAQHTNVAVLGLAGCDITDECMVLLAKHRAAGMERISVNNCHRLTNKTITAFVQHCPNLSVFEMKECHLINDWGSVAELVNRKVLLTLCDQQNRACADWAKRNGRVIHVKAPIK